MNDKAVLGIVVACISALATLGAAYINKLDFNPEHKGVDQRVSDLSADLRDKEKSLVALKQFASREIKPTPRRSDESCLALIKEKTRDANGVAHPIELTMHREQEKLVTYSTGSLSAVAGGGLSGTANQLFSDRSGPGSQPFNLAAADQLDLTLTPTGSLHIHYKPWNFDTDWALSCKGSLMTSYLQNFGVVTLTFRD